MNLFGNEVVESVRRSLGWGPNLMALVFLLKGKLGHRDKPAELMPYEDDVRDWAGISASHTKPRVACTSPETRRQAWSRFPLTTLRRTNSANTLMLHFQPPSE